MPKRKSITNDSFPPMPSECKGLLIEKLAVEQWFLHNGGISQAVLAQQIHLKDAISGVLHGVRWELTPEGHTFWFNYYKRLCRMYNAATTQIARAHVEYFPNQLHFLKVSYYKERLPYIYTAHLPYSEFKHWRDQLAKLGIHI